MMLQAKTPSDVLQTTLQWLSAHLEPGQDVKVLLHVGAQHLWHRHASFQGAPLCKGWIANLKHVCQGQYPALLRVLNNLTVAVS